jgi:hypothetical protein
VGFEDLLKKKLGPMANLVDRSTRPEPPKYDPRELYYRRAVGIEARIRPEETWSGIDFGRIGEDEKRAFVRLDVKEASKLMSLVEWRHASEIEREVGLSPAALWRLVERDLLFFSKDDPGARLTGKAGVLAALTPGQTIARRASAWPTMAVETAIQIAPLPFMPRGADLAMAELVGARFASLERGHEVLGVTITGGKRTGSILRRLLPLLDGRRTPDEVLAAFSKDTHADYPEAFCGFDEEGVFADVVVVAGGFVEGDGGDDVVFIGYHLAEFLFEDELEGFYAEEGGQDAVEGNRCSAALDVAEDGFAYFGLAARVFQLFGELIGYAAQTDVFGAFFAGGSGDASFFRFRAFGDDDIGKAPAFLITKVQALYELLDIVGDLGNETDLGTTGDGGVRGDPPGIAAHHFHDHHAMVAFGRCHELVEAVGGDLYRGLKAEGHIGGGQVIVDGLRHADHRDPLVRQHLRDLLRAVTADVDHRIELQGLELFHELIGAIDELYRSVWLGDGKFYRVRLIGSLQNGPTLNMDSGSLPAGELYNFVRLAEYTIESFDATVHFPVFFFPRAFGDTPYHSV